MSQFIPRNPPILDPPVRLVVCVSGGGTTLQNLFDRIASGSLRAQVSHVIASRPGIGAIERAERAGVPVSIISRKGQDLSDFSLEIFQAARQGEADLMVLAGYLSLIQIPLDYVGRVLNIHPSLIPSFSGKGFHGASVHRAVIDQGVKVTGCTVHFADDTYDTGPIILQKAVEVLEDDTPEALSARVFEAECELLPQAIRLYAEGRLSREGRRVRITPPPSDPILS